MNDQIGQKTERKHHTGWDTHLHIFLPEGTVQSGWAAWLELKQKPEILFSQGVWGVGDASEQVKQLEIQGTVWKNDL